MLLLYNTLTMHAFLLINNDPIQFAKKLNAKIIPFVLQKVEDARNLKKFTRFSNSSKTAIIINDIDTATDEALNAFLKNLEEPNNNLYYILTASNLENVLPTIISRCEVIKSPNTNHRTVGNIEYKDALNIKDRTEAIKFVEDLIYLDHEKKEFNNMENYLNTIKSLKLNGNVSLQMTNLVVRMNGHGR